MLVPISLQIFYTYKLGKPDILESIPSILSAACAMMNLLHQGPETHGHKLLKMQPQAAGNLWQELCAQ